MELEGYEYVQKNYYTNSDGIRTDTYTIKSTVIKQTYIVEILHLEHNIYIIQFYLKCHRHSENKFNLLIPSDIKSSSKHVFLLLNTMVNLTTQVYLKNSLASFGFMGAPTTKENNFKKNSENVNPDRTVGNTKRYRIYTLYVRRYFSPADFTHISFKKASCFLLMNKKNIFISPKIAEDYLNSILDAKFNA